MADHPQARRDGLITQELADELVVYDVDSNEAHCLNAAAAQVWRRCDGETPIEDLAATLEGETDRDVATDVARHALDQLAASALLERSIEPSGITRGQLVRRVGVAAAVALPLVSSIVAPTAAEAQTPPPTTPGGATTTAGPPQTTTPGPPPQVG
jgi:hypothetical protein